jgi:hypothetical protein
MKQQIKFTIYLLSGKIAKDLRKAPSNSPVKGGRKKSPLMGRREGIFNFSIFQLFT